MTSSLGILCASYTLDQVLEKQAPRNIKARKTKDQERVTLARQNTVANNHPALTKDHGGN